MSIIDFRFAEENVLCAVTPDIDDIHKVYALEDSFQSYMDGFVGDNEYNPIEVTNAVMKESGLKYKIIDIDFCVFVE